MPTIHGRPGGRPYYSLDGTSPLTAREWATFRDSCTHQHGLTNVWSHPPLNGGERYRGNGVRSAPRVNNPGRQSAVHLNQKPLEFMRRIVIASTEPGDVIWEPFGGLCSAVVAAVELGRDTYAAERVRTFYDLAVQRVARAKEAVLESASATRNREPEDTRRRLGVGGERHRGLQVAAAG